MSKLIEKINQDLKESMIAKDALTTSVLRLLIAAVRNKEITLRKDGRGELADEQVLEVTSLEIKKRRDSAEAYSQGNRQDLVDQETSEIKILEKYLPEPMSDQELEKIIQEVVQTHGHASAQKDFGRIMGQIMARVKNQADGARVGKLVKKMLVK